VRGECAGGEEGSEWAEGMLGCDGSEKENRDDEPVLIMASEGRGGSGCMRGCAIKLELLCSQLCTATVTYGKV
jgi:hypothetical protein